MKYQKYLVLAFVAALFVPMLGAKSVDVTASELNFNSVNYIELDEKTELGFDTSDYLPSDFDAYSTEFSVQSLNYIEEVDLDLGFDAKDYLPKDFNPYKR